MVLTLFIKHSASGAHFLKQDDVTGDSNVKPIFLPLSSVPLQTI